MICPECGSENNNCKDSRQIRERRRRRYLCNNCGARFTTYEIRADVLRAAQELSAKTFHEISAFFEGR